MSCQLICPNLRCRKILKVPQEARGRVVRCQYCQSMLRVPPAKGGEGTGAAGRAAADLGTGTAAKHVA